MTNPTYQKIGTVTNVNGTTAEIGVTGNMLVVDKPLQLRPDQQERFHGYWTLAWRQALLNDMAMGKEKKDGSDD